MTKKIGLAWLLTILLSLSTPPPTLLAQTGEKPPSPVVILTNAKTQYPLGLYLDYLADPTGELTIDQVSSPEYAAQFTPSQQETLNFGINPQAHWLRFRLQNQASFEQWFLEVGLPALDYVDLYSPQPDGAFQRQAGGDLLPFNRRDVPFHNMTFSLSLPASAEKTYYMRFQNKARLVISLDLWSPPAFARRQYEEMFGLGLFYGVILIMMIYTLFLAALVKDRLYLAYSLYLLILSLAFLTFDGLAYQYLWPALPYWNDVALYTFIGLGVVINLLFSAEFLQLKHYYPRLNRALVALAIVYAGLTILYAFITQNIVINLAINPGLILGAVLSIDIGVMVWRRGYQPAKYHLLFWGIICAATLLQNSSFFQFLPVNFFTENGMRLGVIIALPLLSLALADRVNVTRREKEMAQAAALTAAQEKESLIREQKALLEQQVAARTQELTQAIQRLEQEITERRQAEQAWRESQANLSALIENTDGVIWSVDTAYRLIVGNLVFYRNVKAGFGREFAIGESALFSLIPAAVRDEWRGYYDRALRGEGFTIETQRRFVNQVGWMEYRFNPIYDAAGSISGVTVFGRNITAHKQTEEQLRKLSQAIEQSPSTVIITDLHGKIEYTNPRFTEITGYTLSEVVDQNPRLLKSGQHSAEYYQGLWQTINAGAEWRGELVNRKKNGELYTELASISPIRNAAGEITHFLKVAEDITVRVQVEQTLQRVYHELAVLFALSTNMTSTLELHPLLKLILERLKNVVDFSSATIVTLTDTEAEIRLHVGPRARFDATGLRFNLADVPALVSSTIRQEPLYLPNAPADPNFNRTLKHITQRFGQLDFSHLRTWFFSPLVIRQKVIGLLILVHEEQDFYNEWSREFAQAFANQMALAIENATLYQQAQTAAVTEERNRLARELHDSVTQTLYSINLFTNATAMALAAAKPDVAQSHVQELRALVNEAMLDMRLLIFELRPPVLEEGGLVAALRARLDAVEARSGIKVEFEVVGEDNLTLPIKGELYRIGQEALTNVVKHAQAQQVMVRLTFAARRVALEISDNGVGFDLKNAQQSGKLGLRSMAERADKIKGALAIDSAPGRGATIRVEVNLEENP